MNSFTELLKKDHMSELILVVLLVIYFMLGLKTPHVVSMAVDHMVGKVVLLLIVLYLFLYCNPILAVLAALVAFDLIRRSSEANGGLASLCEYAPSEKKKMSQFTAFNQFPYTLEQEVVAKMAPLVHSGTSFTQSSFKPMLDDVHDATPLSSL